MEMLAPLTAVLPEVLLDLGKVGVVIAGKNLCFRRPYVIAHLWSFTPIPNPQGYRVTENSSHLFIDYI